MPRCAAARQNPRSLVGVIRIATEYSLAKPSGVVHSRSISPRYLAKYSGTVSAGGASPSIRASPVSTMMSPPSPLPSRLNETRGFRSMFRSFGLSGWL